MDDDVIDDFIVLGVPDNVEVIDKEALDIMAERTVASQYKGRRPRALLFTATEWLITSDWREVEAFQPAHDCAACRAGNDQAIAFLKEFPERKLALGNLHYVEVW